MDVIEGIVLYPVETFIEKFSRNIWLRYMCHVDSNIGKNGSKNLQKTQDTKGSAYDFDLLFNKYAPNKRDADEDKGLIVVRTVQIYPSLIYNFGFIQYTRNLKTEKEKDIIQNNHDAEEDEGLYVEYRVKLYSFSQLYINFFDTIMITISSRTEIKAVYSARD